MKFRKLLLGVPVALALTFAPCVAAQAPVASTAVDVIAGTTPEGEATQDWLAMLRKRLPDDQYRAAAAVHKVPTPGEVAWAVLVRARAPAWERMTADLAVPYAPVEPPRTVRVVVGNRGGDDAFTHDAVTIGFDLAALQALYGDASAPDNAARIDRFFRHEFAHILQKAWLAQHPWPATTPLKAALFDIWAEGLGNYYSLSDQWSVQRGMRPDATTRALAELEPRFVARLAALACASPEAAPTLLAGLSSGPFARKWGALPAALWLKEEPGPPDAALRSLVQAGPDGVWDLADRHLPADLRKSLREARLAAAGCARAGAK